MTVRKKFLHRCFFGESQESRACRPSSGGGTVPKPEPFDLRVANVGKTPTAINRSKAKNSSGKEVDVEILDGESTQFGTIIDAEIEDETKYR